MFTASVSVVSLEKWFFAVCLLPIVECSSRSFSSDTHHGNHVGEKRDAFLAIGISSNGSISIQSNDFLDRCHSKSFGINILILAIFIFCTINSYHSILFWASCFSKALQTLSWYAFDNKHECLETRKRFFTTWQKCLITCKPRECSKSLSIGICLRWSSAANFRLLSKLLAFAKARP